MKKNGWLCKQQVATSIIALQKIADQSI